MQVPIEQLLNPPDVQVLNVEITDLSFAQNNQHMHGPE
jgi:hypothetical protein